MPILAPRWTALVAGAAVAALLPACRIKNAGSGVKGDASGGEGLVRITLVGLNDLHGTVEPREVTLGAGEGAVKTRIGGLDAVAAYVGALRARGDRKVLLLDAGDATQGTLISNATFGRPVVDAYNHLQVAAATFGNHEFDFGQGPLKEILQVARYPYLSVNVVPKTPEARFPNTHPSRIFDVGGVRVGVIGATTATTPSQSKAANIAGLEFKALEDTVPAEAARLRRDGAQVVVLITHAGGECDMRRAPETGDEACAMPATDEVTAMLAAAPPETIDVVIAGHMHLAQAHVIRGTPVLQTTGYASSLSMIDLWVDPKAPATAPRKTRIGRQEIHKPTYLCWEHFAAYPSCNPDENKHGGSYPPAIGAPTTPTFQGAPVKVDGAALGSVLEPHRAHVKALSERKIMTLPAALAHDRTKESWTANCLADAFKAASARLASRPVDAAILGSGGVRTGFPQGEVNYAALYAVFPFDNTAAVAELTGKELETYGKLLSATVKSIAVVSEGWGIKLGEQAVFPRHRGFVTADGKPLESERLYTIVTPDYNALPGSETYDAFRDADAAGRVKIGDALIRDIVAEELARPDAVLPASCRAEGGVRTAFVP